MLNRPTRPFNSSIILIVYKFKNSCIHGIKTLGLKYSTTCFNTLVIQHYNNTRDINTDLYKPSVRTNVGKQSISFMATDIWKDLPTSFKKLKCVYISEENYTLSTVKTTNEVIFVHVDHATCVNKCFLLCFFSPCISFDHLPAT